MMRKKIVSLCMALALCLGLLPATALAVGEDAPAKLYVGNQAVIVANTVTYWTTDNSGGLTRVDDATDDSDDWTVRYNPNTATLTLNEATITGSSDSSVSKGAGIYALCSSGKPVFLTIELIGTNTITGSYGIYVDAQQGGTVGTNASLLIRNSSDNGILEVSGSNHGIFVISGTGNASLNIEKATVTSSTDGEYAAGVCVQSSSEANSPQLSLTVNGGSLTTSGTGSSDGIQFYVGSSEATGAITSLTVNNNAIVKAINGIEGYRVDKPIPSGTGIVFDDKEGTVYGDVELQEDLEIGEGETLTIGKDASLTVPDGKTLTNKGTVTNNGTLTNNGTINNSGTLPSNIGGEGVVNHAPTITTVSLPNGTEGTSYSQTLTATGTAPITWNVTSGSLPAGLSLNNGGMITGTPTTAGTSTFTVTATNAYGSDSRELSIKISPPDTVSVTGVTLSQNQASLYYNRTPNTLTLTATVAPDNATNQAVTWTSSDSTVAAVDQNGVVTALARGTAVITATAADGRGASASCTVTVSSYLPPANPNYRITVEATQGGTVTADPTAAKAGATVTLTPVPDRGYQVGAVAVTDRFGDAVAVTEQADGTYTFTMPNGQVTVTVTFEQAPLPFPDVTEGDWFYDAVRYAYETGLMDGVGDNLFAPNSETTRAQLVTILYRLAGEPEPGGDSGFADVAAGTWYTDAVVWAAENGIVNGTTDTTFAPGEDITREQLVTVLYRYAESKGYDVSASADLSGYPDAGQVQDYAQPAMAWAVAEGIVEGVDGNLNPAGNATRAQIATILMRFCEGIQP